MRGSIGILAYGSLLADPGDEIKEATVREVSSLKTPFKVEFARSSKKRGGAPTLVPDERGGSVNAKIFVVDADMSLAETKNRLYRRERNEVGGKREYREPEEVGTDTVVIKSLSDFGGIATVIYTHIGANIEPLTVDELAKRAIASARTQDDGRDGITYLADAMKNGIETPLTPAYAAEIKRRMEAVSLEEALTKVRALGKEENRVSVKAGERDG